MSAGPRLGALHRYHRRFGGTGTIVALDDGHAVTAAHCLAAVDGARGVVIGDVACQWRVLARWSPARSDVALLQALDRSGAAGGSRVPGWPSGRGVRLATRVLVRLGTQVDFVGHTGRRFERRSATVVAVTSSAATAAVSHRAGVCANDSGGPVFVDGVLVGVVTQRTGPPLSCHCSSQLVFTRLDAPGMRRRMRSVLGG